MFLPFNTIKAKKMFQANDGLFNMIHQFNVYPAAYAHGSWFESLMPQDVLNAVRKTQRGRSRLSRILLQHHELGQKACYNFANPWWRFALLPVKVIEALCLYCGLAFMNRQIAAIVDKSALHHIKGSIGDRDYCFAVQRAPLIIGSWQGVAPCWDGSTDIGRLAGQYGAVYFLSHFQDAPHAIAGRLAFKFSKALTELSSNHSLAKQDWQLFKRILVHEIDPRWQPLFS